MDLRSGSRSSVSCPGSYTFVNVSRHDLFCLLCFISLSHVLPFWCVTVLAGYNLHSPIIFPWRSIKCRLCKNCPPRTFYWSLKMESCCVTRAAYSWVGIASLCCLLFWDLPLVRTPACLPVISRFPVQNRNQVWLVLFLLPPKYSWPTVLWQLWLLLVTLALLILSCITRLD